MRRQIVPPYLLLRIARLDDPALAHAAAAARASLAQDLPFRRVRPGERGVEGATRRGEAPARRIEAMTRTISDAKNTEVLPGRPVRGEGEPPSADTTVNEAYEGLGATFALYREVYGRASIDDEWLPLEATVHYSRDYDNAFWDGSRMVFGDGDGQVFRRFTVSPSVIGHELTHGITQFTANLVYRGQPGALNESVSDVFGALVEQYLTRQTADEASWLIGEGLFTDEVEGNALRSMLHPGTAYDDDVLGRDPQPSSMTDYVETDEDNGGVHLNSGIPNRAFALTATALGGNAWERAGWIWYETLTGGALPATASFATFARATIEVAARRFGTASRESDAVEAAWATVEVVPAG